MKTTLKITLLLTSIFALSSCLITKPITTAVGVAGTAVGVAGSAAKAGFNAVDGDDGDSNSENKNEESGY